MQVPKSPHPSGDRQRSLGGCDKYWGQGKVTLRKEGRTLVGNEFFCFAICQLDFRVPTVAQRK